MALDRAFPNGACQTFSLACPQRSPVNDCEVIARVLTEPADYDVNVNELLTVKLTSAHASGLSIIRTGTADDEILRIINRLMQAPDAQQLFGAVVMHAAEVREPRTHFCVYDTDAPGLTLHGDIVGTFDPQLSKSAWKREESRRRRALRDKMAAHVVRASTSATLLHELRKLGI